MRVPLAPPASLPACATRASYHTGYFGVSMPVSSSSSETIVKRRKKVFIGDLDDPKNVAQRARTKEREDLIMKTSMSIRHARYAMLFFGVVSIIMSVVAAEEVYMGRAAKSNWNDKGRNALSDAVKLVASILTIALCGSIIAKNILSYKLKELKGVLLPGQTFFHTLIFTQTLVEVSMAAVHCPMYVYGNVTSINPAKLTIIYDWDSLLSVAMLFLRMHIVVDIVLKDSLGDESPTSRIVTKTLKIRLDSSYAARVLLSDRPIATSIFLYTFCVAMLSYAMRVAERPVCAQTTHLASSPAAGCQWKDLENPYNALWLIFITSLTVGYGDLYPVTHMGRFIAVIAAIIGIILIALVVTAVTTLTHMNADEERGRSEISRRILANKRKNLAAKVIGQALLFRRDRLRNGAALASLTPSTAVTVQPAAEEPNKRNGAKKFGSASLPALAKLSLALNNWHIHRDDWLNNERPQDTSDEVKNDVDELKDTIKAIHSKLDAIMEREGIKVVKKKRAQEAFNSNTLYRDHNGGEDGDNHYLSGF